MNVPIIRLEVQGMKHSLAVALTEYTLQFDETLQAAIEAYCTPENIERIITYETQKTLDTVIREEVKRWFVRGEGREVIRAAVEKRLSENTTWTPLDNVD